MSSSWDPVRLPHLEIPKSPIVVERERAEREWEQVAQTLRHFIQSLPDGYSARVTPSLDPDFLVEGLRRTGDFVHLTGVDEDGNEVLVVQHRTQLSLRMVAIPPEETPERGVFGFTGGRAAPDPDGAETHD